MNVASTVAYLRTQQRADGSFGGFSSPSTSPYKADKPQPTIFPTILILDSLHNVVGAGDITDRAAKYLQSQLSQQGSWNYWDITSPAKQAEPYPDDLDDTACALAALTRNDPAWVDSTRLGQWARLLVAAEQQPGGPYNTWLIDTSVSPQWQQVDFVVNSNIGYALSLQQVHLKGLMSYLDTAIVNGDYTSAYYVGELPGIYFLSRWYQGDQIRILQAKVATLAKQIAKLNALEQALLLSSACRLALPKKNLQKLAQSLQAKLADDHWPAEALYVDPVYNDQQHYGGSEVLTTAFALEALTAYAQADVQVTTPSSPVVSRHRLSAKVRQDAAAIASKQLRRRYLATAHKVMKDAMGEEVTAAASLVAQAGGWRIPAQTLTRLNLASLNGWIAYTLYDNLLDGDGKISQLGVANIALRRSYSYFTQALPDNEEYIARVGKTFDAMDGANDWELDQARALCNKGVLNLRKLPLYGDYHQLAERSLGHSLAAYAVATAHYGSSSHNKVMALQSFFEHFLIARQLNDDAHDWEEDLEAGHLSAVVTLLLQSDYSLPCKLSLKTELDKLRQKFWQTTIDEVAQKSREQIDLAEQHLDLLKNDMNIQVFQDWLDRLEASVAAALRGRNETVQFMKAFKVNS